MKTNKKEKVAKSGMANTVFSGVQPISIDSSLHRELKLKCVQLGSTMREFVERLIREALKEKAE